MSLKAALEAHSHGRIQLAEQHYAQALAGGEHEPVLFQNYGALLRGRGELDRAMELYAQGLQLFPDDPCIRANRVNLLLETTPLAGLADLLSVLRRQPELIESWVTAVTLLWSSGAPGWALQMMREALLAVGPHHKLLTTLLGWFGQWPFQNEPPQQLASLLPRLVERNLEGLSALEQARGRLNLAYEHQRRGEDQQARQRFEEALHQLSDTPITSQDDAEARQKLVDIGSWNYGCMLLKSQDFVRGWPLYDHGLRVPAGGAQRWQRAMHTKPFSAEQLPLWRGESLQGKRLLLLEEQGIGDTMMFASLLPTLLREAERVGLLLSDRLYAIYQRSFGDRLDLWRRSDVSSGALNAGSYQLQCVLGSVCQHRFQHPSAYAPELPLLQVDAGLVADLRRRYLDRPGAPPVERLIGISWSGGGVRKRIEEKSTPLQAFASLMKPLPGTRFVSLQYGQVASTVQRWQDQGYDVIHDPERDPLKDMDGWLHQVAACDAVLTVANTTVHGSGGLNLPTMCLLSRYSDWRWLEDARVLRSYWYPCVGIARESHAQGWRPALQLARAWLENGSPMPTGPSSIDTL